MNADTQSNLNPLQYRSKGGVLVQRTARLLDYGTAMDELIDLLDAQPGVVLKSGVEYPGRYSRWDLGFTSPPVQISASGRKLQVKALNARGEVLLPELNRALAAEAAIKSLQYTASRSFTAEVRHPDPDPASDLEPGSAEEQRSRRPSIFSALRALREHFASPADPFIGLIGAFGYDLTFQFEDVVRHQHRAGTDRDLLLYLPDRILVSDHRAEQTVCYSYEFLCRREGAEQTTETTGGLKRRAILQPFQPPRARVSGCDHSPGEFAAQVERAKHYFQRGDLFEVVPGQTFSESVKDSPSGIFRRLSRDNPAPYGAFINLGQQEYLVAASPEMFVSVQGRDIETCPISGTIKRGADALGDAEQIRRLLNSAKDDAELSMCTDVDRNDKARVCEPGSVHLLGRRQIEMYSRLIHTVDHVKGTLRQGMDALDGFLAHTWAVTVTGAPKLAAMQYLERFEKSPRHWYGGALGVLNFNGDMNTGLTLRTVRIKDGVAEIRAGATLLNDSEPVAEEQETRLKAAALIDSVRGDQQPTLANSLGISSDCGAGLRVLMVDHQDSFVHSLADYFRRCGADLQTHRPASARALLRRENFDLVVLSPGPGRPADFDVSDTIEAALAQGVALFGVCLGLQGLVEYFGGALGQLAEPVHGKASLLRHAGSRLFRGVATEFTAGRYHSLVAAEVPACFSVSARSEDDVVMAVEHDSLPIAAVQFHPESIMTCGERAGQILVQNVLRCLCPRAVKLQPDCESAGHSPVKQALKAGV